MSDENQGAASSTVQTVPIERLNEVIAERNAERQEKSYLAQTLNTLVQQQRASQAPAPRVDPELEALKESNPGLYKRLVAQERRAKELSAGYSMMHDQLDKTNLIIEKGDEAKKRLNDIEVILERERQQGNFKITRGQIYDWMRGQEALKAQSAPKKTEETPKVKAADDAPSSDPKFASATGGTAPSNTAQMSREERIKALENVKF